MAALTLSLKIRDRYWENISIFSFNILTGISSCVAAIAVLKFLISFAITSLSTETKENSVGFLKYCFILKMLGCLLHFLLGAITDQFHLFYHKRCSHLFQCLMCSPCYQKNELKVSAIFVSSAKTSTSVILLFLELFFFSEKWRNCFPE